MNKESEQEAFVNSQPEERTESLPAGGADKPDGVKTEAEAGTRAGGEYDGSRPEGEAIKTAAEETEKKEETAIAVRFNGKDRQVSPEDARSYVEMGMKWETFRPAQRLEPMRIGRPRGWRRSLPNWQRRCPVYGISERSRSRRCCWRRRRV